MVCSVWTAALACSTLVFLAEGTQIFSTARAFYKRPFESCIAYHRTHDSQGPESMRRPVHENGVPSRRRPIRDIFAKDPLNSV